MRSLKRARLFGAVALAVVVGGAAFAFTAANTVPDSNAGQGTGNVNGYTVSNIHYTYGSPAPNSQDVDTVSFTLSAPAASANVSLDGGSGWQGPASCTNPSANDWTCDVQSLGVALSKVVALDVAAAQ